MVRPEKEPDRAPASGKFDQAEVRGFVELLRAGENPASLKTEPMRQPWLIPWPGPAWGRERGPGSVTVWSRAFDYEVIFEFRLPGRGRKAGLQGPAGADHRLALRSQK
jgi:hypothetical protein